MGMHMLRFWCLFLHTRDSKSCERKLQRISNLFCELQLKEEDVQVSSIYSPWTKRARVIGRTFDCCLCFCNTSTRFVSFWLCRNHVRDYSKFCFVKQGVRAGWSKTGVWWYILRLSEGGNYWIFGRPYQICLPGDALRFSSEPSRHCFFFTKSVLVFWAFCIV